MGAGWNVFAREADHLVVAMHRGPAMDGAPRYLVAWAKTVVPQTSCLAPEVFSTGTMGDPVILTEHCGFVAVAGGAMHHLVVFETGGRIEARIVGNTRPVANFTVTPEEGDSSTAFQFDASGCSDATDDPGELQVRWGTLSCQSTCLPVAEALLEKANRPGQDPVREIRRAVVLGGLRFRLLLSDDQAKANVNLLARRRGEKALPAILRKLQTDCRSPLTVRLRLGVGATPDAAPRPPQPGQAGAPEPPVPATFSSVEQLFALSHPSELVGRDDREPSVARRVTCWGNGRVNLRRAERPVLRGTLTGLLTETGIAKLEALRRDKPGVTLTEVSQHLALAKDKAEALGQVATDASQCHGLWVIAQGATRSWYSFHVASTGSGEADAAGGPFTW